MAIVVLATPSPAAAHSTAGVSASNYTARVEAVDPPVAGIDVRIIDVGTRIELRNRSGRTVTVLGYEGEPYLRVAPDGVYQNVRSPAVYLNRKLLPTVEQSPPPPSADPTAPPRWERVSGGSTARWHDHRAHWMGSEDPPAVRRAPGREHVVINGWQVPMRLDDRRLTVSGDVVWVPGPSPWPWVALALGLAVLVLLGSRLRWWPTLMLAAVVMLMVATGVHIGGQWDATSSGLATRLGAAVYPALAGTAAAGAAWQLARRGDPNRAIPMVLLGGLASAIVVGLGDITALTRSQLVFAGPPSLARVAVVVGLGAGAGLTAAAALRLKQPDPARKRRDVASSAAVLPTS
jgi:hypothetical protein